MTSVARKADASLLTEPTAFGLLRHGVDSWDCAEVHSASLIYLV